MTERVCKDCWAAGVRTQRATPYPGPRCATHHRVKQRADRLAASARRTATVYGITAEQRAAILAAQGGACAICQRAKGNPTGVKGKRQLAVDHDHSCCPGKTSCGRCVRGLLCGPCNDVLAHLRDDPAAFYRAIRYLADWPSLRANV